MRGVSLCCWRLVRRFRGFLTTLPFEVEGPLQFSQFCSALAQRSVDFDLAIELDFLAEPNLQFLAFPALGTDLVTALDRLR
jgi:hypothetical protein